MIKSSRFLIPLCCVIVMLIILPSLRAQSIWQDYKAKKSIFLEILNPEFDDGNESFLTSSMFLSAKAPIARNIKFVLELPFTHFGWEIPEGPVLGDQNTFGNPYFGIEFGLEQLPLFFELGARAPLAPSGDEDNGTAALMGALTDYVDRAEAFASDMIPITGFANLILDSPTGFRLHLRSGASFWMAIGDRDESETFIIYSALAWYKFTIVQIGAGFSGRYITTEEYGDFAENSLHQLGFALNISLRIFKPGVFVRIPLDDDFKDFMDVVWGVSLGIRLD